MMDHAALRRELCVNLLAFEISAQRARKDTRPPREAAEALFNMVVRAITPRPVETIEGVCTDVTAAMTGVENEEKT